MAAFIPVYQPDLSGNELEYVTDCIRSGWISSIGKYVDLFEREFAHFCGVNQGVAVMNGTVALHLALRVLDVGVGDEVIVPDLTFVATPNAVRYTGAQEVLVDSDSETWQMDPRQIEQKITPRTKAIIVVHIYGHPVNIECILDIARKHGLKVVEDAAEAHGAEFKGRRVGSLGDVAAFSFYGNKAITTGEGGILVTDDAELAERARFLKDHAMSAEKRYWHSEIGYNYRMTNMQAAIGVAQLERAEKTLQRKRAIAQMYAEQLCEAPGVVLHPEAPWAKCSYWMYSILIGEECALSRDEMMLALKAEGIDSRPFFYPIHQLPPYRGAAGEYPVADELSRRGMNLPSYPSLTDEQVRFVGNTILAMARGKGSSRVAAKEAAQRYEGRGEHARVP